ncbi:MAG: rhamnogalacturonan acetylesterase [Akkermansiaceae bacterium]|nr:rhamnogalacturonan acetylesterase [Akkermansiaceae bacterium]MCP5544161.1 rhamnogalacturonan acetylesterase [Akkermansiaceae bacterium]MCP5547782.1 rhamnogalacturonan acetylesterase [Akkermansiaceae bacterium]
MTRSIPFLSFLACLVLPLACAAETLDDQPVEKDRGAAGKEDASLPTLWIIGDSTVKVGTPGQRGWGDELAPFFDTSKINLVNRAIGGRSSRTFLTEGRWDEILKELRKGDFVIMQFGHNDASPINEKPPVNASTRARGVIRNNSDETVDVINILTGKPETVHSYGWYLRRFTTTAKERGATAIVCSPIPRKSWNEEGNINRATASWTLWARQAAEQTGADFIDLNEIIARSYERIGPEKVEPLFADQGTHTSPEGAAFNARAVVSGLRSLDRNPLAFALSAEGKAVPAFAP